VQASALTQVPVSDLTTPPNQLHDAAKAVLGSVIEALNFIGFRLDTPQLTVFCLHIDRHDFPSVPVG